MKISIRILTFVLFVPVFGRAAETPPPGASFDAKADIRFPACNAVVDISKAPYSAKGDGVTDDTAAIQKALFDLMGQHKILYFPNGTYLISKPLVWSKKNSNKQDAWGFNFLQGQNPVETVIRLKDSTFTDVKSPQSMMWCGGFGSADWFHNYIQGLTFSVGKGNPGAVGLQFYSNNTGAVRDVAVVSDDGEGFIGLDLGHRDMNGPLLVKNVRVKGFATGIRCAGSVNSQDVRIDSPHRTIEDRTGEWGAIDRYPGVTQRKRRDGRRDPEFYRARGLPVGRARRREESPSDSSGPSTFLRPHRGDRRLQSRTRHRRQRAGGTAY